MRLFFTAERLFHPGKFSIRSISLKVRSIENPQGIKIKISGSAKMISSKSMNGECSPSTVKIEFPPAIFTKPGTQFPASIIGSIHSMQATDGLFSKNLSLCLIISTRSSKLSISSSALSGTSRISLTRRIPVKISSRVADSSEMIFTLLFKLSFIANSTSAKETAQTSHCVCVMITSGFKLEISS